MTDQEFLREWFQQTRSRLGLTQKELGIYFGMPQRSISHLETGGQHIREHHVLALKYVCLLEEE